MKISANKHTNSDTLNTEDHIKTYNEFKKKHKTLFERIIKPLHKKRLIVTIDHELGGGSNLYSSLMSDNLIADDFIYIRISYNNHTKIITLSFNSLMNSRTFFLEFSDILQLKDLIISLTPDHILVNELVSWQNPLDLAKSIKDLGIPYTVFIHDYFYSCPNWTLINYKGEYCNLPNSVETCNNCLINNNLSDFYNFYGNAYVNITLWRQEMRSFLQDAEQIVCFSENTRDNILKTYHSNSTIIIAEHSIKSLESFSWKQRKYNVKEPLNIGVLGNIAFHKGDEILKDIINHPEYNDLPVNIIVIGNTRSFPAGYISNNKKFRVYGDYHRQDIADILEKYNISAIFIPSIWPETFSFTTSEALLLGYPVLCFDVGAPAERIKKYNAGIIIDSISADEILKALKNILKNPHLIKEFSTNTKHYVPPTVKDHLKQVFHI